MNAEIGDGELTDEQLIYKENIIDHYKHPRNKKILSSPTAKQRQINPSCGDSIEVSIVVEGGKIIDVGFQGQGCAISQASMDMLAEKIKGMDVASVQEIKREDVLEMLGIPIGVVRTKCALLGLRTTQGALK